MALHIRQTYHEGFLPSPEQLERYALAHPDAVKTILEIAVRQQEIDFEVEKAQHERLMSIERASFDIAHKQIETSGRYASQGQWVAFAMMLCFFVLLRIYGNGYDIRGCGGRFHRASDCGDWAYCLSVFEWQKTAEIFR